MRKTILLLIIALCGRLGFSQTLTPDVWTTSGDYFTSANNSLSWTIGECVIETYSSTNNILTQGFQQSNYSITSVQETGNGNYSVTVYPNPASSFINISAESAGAQKSRVELLDMNGSVIHSEVFQNNLQLNLSGYADSEYLIRIYDEKNNPVKTLKLQKIN